MELREDKIFLPTLGAQTFRLDKALMLLNFGLSVKEMPTPLKEVGLRDDFLSECCDKPRLWL